MAFGEVETPPPVSLSATLTLVGARKE